MSVSGQDKPQEGGEGGEAQPEHHEEPQPEAVPTEQQPQEEAPQ